MADETKELLARVEALEALATQQAADLAKAQSSLASPGDAQVRAKKKPEGPPPIVTIGGKKYQFLYHVAHVKGFGRIVATKAAQDSKECEKLLAAAGKNLFKEV